MSQEKKGSVLLPWTQELSYMQQSVLICAVRGPDGIRKDHPVKVLCRWLRRCIMISAFNRRQLTDPYEKGGGSFTGPCQTDHVLDLTEAREFYFRCIDELPHHFQLHLMHAAEILGYKYPLDRMYKFEERRQIWDTRTWWFNFYLDIVKDAHLFPELEVQMDKRLGDYEDAWRAQETVTAF